MSVIATGTAKVSLPESWVTVPSSFDYDTLQNKLETDTQDIIDGTTPVKVVKDKATMGIHGAELVNKHSKNYPISKYRNDDHLYNLPSHWLRIADVGTPIDKGSGTIVSISTKYGTPKSMSALFAICAGGYNSGSIIQLNCSIENNLKNNLPIDKIRLVSVNGENSGKYIDIHIKLDYLVTPQFYTFGCENGYYEPKRVLETSDDTDILNEVDILPKDMAINGVKIPDVNGTIANAEHPVIKQIDYTTDLSELRQNGWYWGYSMTNGPSSSLKSNPWIISVKNYSNTGTVQIATELVQNRTWINTYYSSSWNGWKEITSQRAPAQANYQAFNYGIEGEEQ